MISGLIKNVSAANLEHNIERQRDRTAALKLTVQLFIIIVGHNVSLVNTYYICIDNTFYKICYKCFFVLHACYPKKSPVWFRIQKCLYKMKTDYSDSYSDVINNKVASIEKEFYNM
ncbi:hypothetical protein P5V15_012723 [Pogonomyrmex californicus]